MPASAKKMLASTCLWQMHTFQPHACSDFWPPMPVKVWCFSSIIVGIYCLSDPGPALLNIAACPFNYRCSHTPTANCVLQIGREAVSLMVPCADMANHSMTPNAGYRLDPETQTFNIATTQVRLAFYATPARPCCRPMGESCESE